MKPAFLILDNLDDRREIWAMMDRLHPWRRVEFLNWCGSQVKLPATQDKHPKVSFRIDRLVEESFLCEHASMMLTNELFHDLWCLASQYEGFDWVKVTKKLEAMVKDPKPRIVPPKFSMQRIF